MTTPLDRADPNPGYWPSAWPVECGGNRRQKARVGRLDAATGTAEVVTRRNDRWNVMVVERDPGEWFLGGTMRDSLHPNSLFPPRNIYSNERSRSVQPKVYSLQSQLSYSS